MQKAEWCGFPLNTLFGEESRHGAELEKLCVCGRISLECFCWLMAFCKGFGYWTGAEGIFGELSNIFNSEKSVSSSFLPNQQRFLQLRLFIGIDTQHSPYKSPPNPLTEFTLTSLEPPPPTPSHRFDSLNAKTALQLRQPASFRSSQPLSTPFPLQPFFRVRRITENLPKSKVS